MAIHGDGTENESMVRVSASSHEAETEVYRAAHEVAESTPVVEVGPTGVDSLSPLVLATHEGETAFIPRCSIEHAQSVVATLDDGTLPDDAETVVEHPSNTATLPTPQTGPLGIGSRHALASCGWSVPANIADYTESRENGLLTEHFMEEPETVREYITASGLRGRGRGDMSADAPIADDWKTVRNATGDPVVVVNGNETDDHAASDCLLLESAPLTVLDPALVAAHALDATAVAVHVNETETVARERVEGAVDALTDATETGLSVSVVAGPDEYKAGEPTMALEVLEGNHRIEARRGPPSPE